MALGDATLVAVIAVVAGGVGVLALGGVLVAVWLVSLTAALPRWRAIPALAVARRELCRAGPHPR